jgi:hypothetical protein
MGQERSFLDQLIGLLQQVKAGNTGAIEAELSASGQDDVVNVAIYAALAEREQELRAAGEWDSTSEVNLGQRSLQWEYRNRDGANTRRVHETAQMLSKINRRTSAENVEAIAAEYAMSDAGLSTSIERRIADRCVTELLNRATPLLAVGTYAVEVGAIVQSPLSIALSPVGEDLLQLRGRDFVRMLLANEVARSTGDLDDWRISAAHARHLLRVRQEQFGYNRDEDAHPYRFSARSLMRMSDLGVCLYDMDGDDHRYYGETFTLTDEGAEALADTVARGPTPFTLRAAALLRDSNERLLPEAARRGTNTAQLVEHAQMVAHELGNKLSAMSQRIEMLRAKASAEGTGDAVSADIDRVQRIIENIQAFADDQARIAGAADARAALFDVATRDAGDHREAQGRAQRSARSRAARVPSRGARDERAARGRDRRARAQRASGDHVERGAHQGPRGAARARLGRDPRRGQRPWRRRG